MDLWNPEPEPSRKEDLNFEHRRTPRVSLLHEVVCEGAAAGARSEAADISLGGMFIDIGQPPFAKGDLVTVFFVLDPSEPRLSAPAEVHYVQAGIGMGIRFLELGETERERIQAFVDEITARKSQGNQPPLRKSARVSVEVPVRVRALHPDGTDLDERTKIITLSKHGACFCTTHPLGVGTKVYLETTNGREFKSSIVWVGSEVSRSLGQVGVQCRGLAQALGFQFP
jgi:hypothetical protein